MVAIENKQNFQEWLDELSFERNALRDEKQRIEDDIAKCRSRRNYLNHLAQSMDSSDRNKMHEGFTADMREREDQLKVELEQFEREKEDRLAMLEYLTSKIENQVSVM